MRKSEAETNQSTYILDFLFKKLHGPLWVHNWDFNILFNEIFDVTYFGTDSCSDELVTSVMSQLHTGLLFPENLTSFPNSRLSPKPLPATIVTFLCTGILVQKRDL